MIEGRAAVPAEGTRFGALDGWRGICALLVVCFHAPVTGFAEHSPFVRNAFLFVDFFFVLSGFVIAHAFFDRLKETKAAGRFLLSRLFRVYPLHLFMLALYVAVECAIFVAKGPGEAFHGGTSIEALVVNLLMLQSLGLLDTLTWNYPSWSISAELVAYACFALVVVTVPRLMLPLCGLVVLLALPVIAAVKGHMDVSSDLGWLRCLVGFAIGVLLRRAVWHEPERAKAKRYPASWTLTEIAAVLLVFVFVSELGGTVLTVAAPLVFGLALYVFAHEGGAISRALTSRPIAFLGTISYSIYMTHAFVIDRFHNAASVAGRLVGRNMFVEAAFDRELIATPGWMGSLLLVAMIAATIFFSAVTYRFVETPGMALGRRFMAKRQSAAAADRTVAAA
ncbi:acyltransferase family protein [Jiella sonneratiae]|uniref:Acyltransferase n=1 Tax=Jiella sonneratiae TaxID=2816856 RepID=A0ABS3J677_9HYPH|nr:acyltransferase [Jiella sonneratiae]MBO0904076.1 acyltransferase [Jiella sonneratiae]